MKNKALSQMKTFTQGNRTYGAIWLPDYAREGYISWTGFLCFRAGSLSVAWQNEYGHDLKLTSKDKIIGLFRDLTEEQAKDMVDETLGSYLHYESLWYISSAKRSLSTRLQSLGFKEEDNVLLIEIVR